MPACKTPQPIPILRTSPKMITTPHHLQFPSCKKYVQRTTLELNLEFLVKRLLSSLSCGTWPLDCSGVHAPGSKYCTSVTLSEGITLVTQ